MGEILVLGERCDELFAEIVELHFTFPPGELAEVTGRVPTEGALMRAFHRAEAELLVADAEAMRNGTYRHRTPGQRRADAFALVLLRCRSVKAGDRRAVGAPTVGSVPARRRKGRSR